MNRAAVVAGTLVALLAGLSVPPAQAQGRGRTYDVVSTFTDPGFLTRIENVQCGSQQDGVCLITTHGHSTVTGDLSGWTDYTQWMYPTGPGTFRWYTDETFTGTVAGCGTGSFRFLVQDGTVAPDDANPLAEHFEGTWTLVESSAGLEGLTSGKGYDFGDAYPDTSARGTFGGTVTCR